MISQYWLNNKEQHIYIYMFCLFAYIYIFKGKKELRERKKEQGGLYLTERQKEKVGVHR